MNKDLLESQWMQIRDILMEKFNNLSEEDIREINGRYDQLVAKLQQKYGYTREEAEERIRNWNFDRFAAKTHMMRDEKMKERNDSSLYKWLLGIGIPLLLLGTYFLARPADTMNRQPAMTQEQMMIQETPADRMMSNELRNTLMSQQNLAFAMQNVQITTRDGVVTLSGTVPNAEMRNFIGTAAERFAGVKQVINNIRVQ